MTEGNGAFLRVGLLIVTGAALAIGLVWFLGGSRIRSGVVYESYFSESVQGLEVGVAVKYRGVAIGRVTDIGLVTAEYRPDAAEGVDQAIYRLVFVRYMVDPKRLGRVPDTATAVNLGLRARLASVGLTGVTYIELDFVDPKRNPTKPVPWEPRAAYIPTVPTTLSQVEEATKQLIEQVSQVDVGKLSKIVAALMDDTDAFVRELREQTRAADVPGLLADMRQTSASLRTLAENQDIQRTLAGSAAATAQLTKLIAQIPPLIGTVRGVTQRADASVADTQQALAPLLRDIQATIANLREVTEALRRNPAQILVGQPPPRQPEHRP